MSARRTGRIQDCDRGHARTRLRQAELFLEVAHASVGDGSGERATVAAANAVNAAIAAADALCCALAGRRHRGSDHRGAADLLDQVSGDQRLAALLRQVLDLEDQAQYGLSNVREDRARSAIRKAGQLVEAARERVRG
jgi:HEPN domain-containing protein